MLQTDQVQRILNAAARLVRRIPRFHPISSLIRNKLHWLPAAQRAKFKTLLLVANSIGHRAPSYLQELCVLVSTVHGRCRLRSAEQFCLVVQRCRPLAMQRRGFPVAGPSVVGMNCPHRYALQFVRTVTAQKTDQDASV